MKLWVLIIGLVGLVASAAAEADEPPWLGVWLSDAVDGGVEIVAIAPNGPAQRAGLARGDILLEVGGETVRREDALGRLLRRSRPGDALELVVLRGGESLRTRVELGRRPARLATRPRVPELPQARWEAYSAYVRARSAEATPFGLQAVGVTPALRAYFGAPEMSGVLVTRVEPGRLAAQAGLQVGDVLLSIDKTEIDDTVSLLEALSTWDRAKPLEARIVRAGKPQLVRVSAPAARIEAVEKAQRERERALLERRLSLEIERLERRIQELRRNVERIREER